MASVTHVAALRIAADLAVASIEPDVRIDGIVAGADRTGQAAVVGVNRVRQLARIRVPPAQTRQPSLLPLTSLQTPAYVVAVEGSQAGATLRPILVGRGDRFGSSRWTRPLLPLGGSDVSAGALLFTMTG
jgi:hypothetical protein